jgi:hypothetical protein
MKTMWILLIILLATTAIATADIRVQDRLDITPPQDELKAGVQTICIDGHKFVYAFGWAARGTTRGVGAGGGVSIIQVYEERNGKVVPARCNQP